MQVRTGQDEPCKQLMNWNWRLPTHSLYLPDITPSDFHSFRSLQHFLSDKKFDNLNDIQNTIFEYFAQRSINFYRPDVENLHTGWRKVVDNKGDYIMDEK